MNQETSSSSTVRVLRGAPRDSYRRWREGDGNSGLLLVEFELNQYWLPGNELQPLTALYYHDGHQLQVAVTDQVLQPKDSPASQQFARWVRELGLCVAIPDRPLRLSEQYVAKPWGQEIWYTGVEERGVCGFGTGDAVTPIPWLQAVLPGDAAGVPGQGLVLLKILDPVSEEIRGDLYFELHEEKREVYVVTRIDRRAWPDGVGYIRYGFDPVKLAEADSERAFRRSYLCAVQDYEKVRRELDSLPDREEAAPEQLEQERVLRKRMDSYTCMRPLAVGDVVVVPLLMPHSLQHGVRTIEFQTPVYERQILSFAQKVLTQAHWDTEAAVAQMRLTPPDSRPFACLHSEPGIIVERIVDFPDFEVLRVRIEGPQGMEVTPLDHYGLVMVVEGNLEVGGDLFVPEQALLLPRHWSGKLSPPGTAPGLVFLLALPRP